MLCIFGVNCNENLPRKVENWLLHLVCLWIYILQRQHLFRCIKKIITYIYNKKMLINNNNSDFIVMIFYFALNRDI